MWKSLQECGVFPVSANDEFSAKCSTILLHRIPSTLGNDVLHSYLAPLHFVRRTHRLTDPSSKYVPKPSSRHGKPGSRKQNNVSHHDVENTNAKKDECVCVTRGDERHIRVQQYHEEEKLQRKRARLRRAKNRIGGQQISADIEATTATTSRVHYNAIFVQFSSAKLARMAQQMLDGESIASMVISCCFASTYPTRTLLVRKRLGAWTWQVAQEVCRLDKVPEIVSSKRSKRQRQRHHARANLDAEIPSVRPKDPQMPSPHSSWFVSYSTMQQCLRAMLHLRKEREDLDVGRQTAWGLWLEVEWRWQWQWPMPVVGMATGMTMAMEMEMRNDHVSKQNTNYE